MSNELIQYTIGDIEKMGIVMAKSGLFGVKLPEQAMALMLISQAEGRHPALAARDYHVISVEGVHTPSKKAEAMLRDFQHSGGKVEWEQLDDTAAIATFSHPAGGTIKIDWTTERAQKAGLAKKPMWSKFPRAMLRSRCISEGVRTVFPAATSGFYEPGEVQDFDDKPVKKMKDVTPKTGAGPYQAEGAAEVVTPFPPPDKPIDYRAFGKEFSDSLKRCMGLEDLDDLKGLHTDKLLAMATAWPEGFARIEVNIEKTAKNLTPIETVN